MRQQSTRRTFLVLLSALLVAFAFLSGMLAATHAMHNCMDDQCEVCAIIHNTQMLRHLSFLAALSLFSLLALTSNRAGTGRFALRRKVTTLISLKIRLNP